MIRLRFALFAVPLLLVACGGSSEDNSGTPGDEDDIKKAKGAVGAVCDEVKTCKTGLVCKEDQKGPPPGAVGLPIPPGSTNKSSGPPPGAMGLPMKPVKHCAEPGPGEEGGYCSASTKCASGLTCIMETTAPGSGPNFPPGAMGMPMQPHGTCQKSSGPPPGAMGMPLRP